MNLLFADRLRSQGNRVLLSGLGGDEVLGGVPTPLPELADLITRGRLGTFGKQIHRWALANRTPVFHLFGEMLRSFLPTGVLAPSQVQGPAAWLDPRFVTQNRHALSGYKTRLKLFAPLPTFQENLAVLEGLRRQLACSLLPSDPPLEKRYPYLDRDLLEFIYAIPREQLLRPGERRSLMRRALSGIVPAEILYRRRKAFVTRSPRVAISSQWDLLVQMTDQMVSGSLRIVDPKLFCDALEKARHDPTAQITNLMRAIRVEMWLRALRRSSLASIRWPAAVHSEVACRADDLALPLTTVFSAESNSNTERR